MAKKKTSKKATTKKPAASSKKQASAATSKKTAKKVTKKVAKKTTKKVTKKVAKKTTKKVTKKDAAKAEKPSAKKTTKKAASKSGSGSKSPRRKIDFANPKSVAAAAVTSKVDSDGYVFINGRRVRAISTKGLTVKKKTRTTKAVVAVDTPDNPDVSQIKTKMNKKEIDVFRDLLLEKRRAIVGMVSGLENEALKSSGGNLSNMPIHMADVGSDVFEQDFTLGMAETERNLLHEIDGALERIVNKTYGVCQSTGKTIPKARLKAKPWAKFTVEAARANERSIVAE